MKKRAKTVYCYSAEFKIRVILDMLEHDLNIHEVIRKYWNVTQKCDVDRYRSTVRTWKRIYEEKGARGFMSNIPPRKPSEPSSPAAKKTEGYDLATLLAENEQLRMENMYLKKLRALILKEESEKRSWRK